MHKSSFLRMKYLVKYYEVLFTNEEKNEIDVLDVGSCDVNGTYREIFKENRYHYVGLDMANGTNVDIVPKDIYHWDEIKDETYDLVISGQVFEHVEYPWLTIREIARVLKPSGICIIIAPSAGIEHKYPKDCYRYFSDGLKALAKWADLKVHHASVGGVPQIKDLKDWINDWNEGCLVAQKQPYQSFTKQSPFVEERRVPTYGYNNTYRIWKFVVNEVCKKFDNKKKIVLFGAGWIGSMVLDILGEDNVEFFVDNSKEKIGKKYRGKKIISFEEYLKNSNQYNCLITASYNASLQIKKQMETVDEKCEILYLA